MPSKKFIADKTFTSGTVTVEVGHKGSKRLVKISLGEDNGRNVVVYDMDEADTVADLLDDALDYYDEHPEIWS